MLSKITPLRRLYFILLFSGVSFLTAAQTSDSLRAAQLLSNADSLQTIEQYQQSNEKAQAAAVIFESLEAWPNYLTAYRTVFFNGYKSGDYESHVQLLEAGLKKIPVTELLHRSLLEYYIAFSYDSFGEVQKSMDYYQKCIVQFEAAKDTIRLSKIYGNLGVGFMKLSDFDQSLEYVKSSIVYSELAQDVGTLWRNYINLGRNYLLLEEYDLARKAYSTAREIHDPEDGTFEYYSASVFTEEQLYLSALTAIDVGIAQAKNAGSNAETSISHFHSLKSACLIKAGQFTEAIPLLEALLEQPNAERNARSHAELLTALAEAKRGIGQFDMALAHLQNALQVLLPNYHDEGPSVLPTLANDDLETRLIPLFYQKGNCYWDKFEQGSQLVDLKLANDNFKMATSQIERVKLNYANRQSSAFVGDVSRPYYEWKIKTAIELSRRTKDAAYAEEAFDVAQQANAFLLRDLVNEREAIKVANIPKAEQTQRKELIENLRLVDVDLANPDTTDIDSLKTRRFALIREREALVKRWIRENSKYAKIRSSLATPKLEDLQKGLQDSTLLLKYFLGETELFIFSLSNDDFQVDTLALPAKFKMNLKQYRRSIGNMDFIKDSMELAEQEYLESAYSLFQLLLEKPLIRKSNPDKQFSRLTIVADGLLNTIPFQALLMEPAQKWTDVSKMAISKYAIGYHFFCKNMINPPEQKIDGGDFVSFGLEFDSHTLDYLKTISKDSISNPAILENLRSGALTNLPFSDEEAIALAELMNGQSWTNAEATKANFLANSATADIIHLATHSILDNTDPEKSALVFTRPSDNQDNLLRLSEIYALDLEARLVVLSACNTAYGALQEGEGLVSLARAYQLAGVPSVTATLWNVADEASKKIMELYYENLKEGLEKDKALQQAQLSYLTDEEISSPAFRLPVHWAAWVSIGSEEAVVQNELGKWMWGLGIALLLILVVVYMGRDRLVAR